MRDHARGGGAGSRGLSRTGSYDRGSPRVGAAPASEDAAMELVWRAFQAFTALGMSPTEARRRIVAIATSLEAG